jgi:acyl-CoA synthetase (AMP-forming)/AMP-acid ligase II
MRLIDYLDKGASLGEDSPCLTTGEADLSYAEVQRVTYRLARALARAGIKPGDKVAVLSGNDPLAFACVFGISRAAAVWCPINPRNEAAENRYILDAFDCRALIFHSAYETLVERMIPDLPKLGRWSAWIGTRRLPRRWKAGSKTQAGTSSRSSRSTTSP